MLSAHLSMLCHDFLSAACAARVLVENSELKHIFERRKFITTSNKFKDQFNSRVEKQLIFISTKKLWEN